MKVTLGGDRLGSGNKNKIALRNYERSTHNLSQRWISSMAPGILYPFLCIPTMRGDKFEIDLEAAARTIPTQGPLFGSYKMQLDIFQCPFRLYQAILHNNPTAIGLKMNQVKFPQLEIFTKTYKNDKFKGLRFSNSCLLKYLGMSGLGKNANNSADSSCGRTINAIPALAYYDIFKNYYSNKQEDNAYVITNEQVTEYTDINNILAQQGGTYIEYQKETYYPITNNTTGVFSFNFNKELDKDAITIQLLEEIEFIINDIDAQTDESVTLGQLTQDGYVWNFNINKNQLAIYIEEFQTVYKNYLQETTHQGSISFNNINLPSKHEYKIKINAFPLSNIDDMRMKVLSHSTLGTPFVIKNDDNDNDGTWDRASGGTGSNGLPYTTLVDREGVDHNEETFNKYNLNGLVLKTYQSDLFNNWINTEWIDGENGIAAITAISTASGDKFTIDALNLAEKLYNMLNRIAVSGGTYEDWQDAVYMESPRRHMESPVYLGGMSSEVVFEEIVQSAPATTSGDGGKTTELGTLGGRGVLVKRKGGNVTVKCDEASFIIGIVSLTPRLVYTQGNEFYLTDLQSMDDLHKPAMDGIGFQNLIAERAAWWDTTLTPGGTSIVNRNTLGKVPAWIEYMTAVDKAYGDFAEENGKAFMVLSRNYEKSDTGSIKDATTYIDPEKFNYAFAYTELDAQNFWVQIISKIRARRLMSAKQIPNI